MNFDLSDDERSLQESVREVLASEGARARSLALVSRGDEGCDLPLWRTMGELGWLSASAPEVVGGSGMGGLAVCLIAQELGRSAAAVPFTSSIVLAADLVTALCDPAQAARLAGPLIAGERIAAVALDSLALARRRAPLHWSNGRVTGMLGMVPGAAAAHLVLAPAQCAEGVRMCIIDLTESGVSRRRCDGLDAAHPSARISLSEVSCDTLGERPLAADELEGVLGRAAVGVAFEQVGLAEGALFQARDYVLERHAFGRSLGSFQAVKHKLADIWAQTELAISAALHGAWAREGADDRMLGSAPVLARVMAGAASQTAAAENIHLHGGVGFTWEFGCHLYYRRAKALAAMLGPDAYWRSRLASAAQLEA